MANGREDAIREWMRREWGARSRFYTAYAAPKNRPFAEALVGLVRPAPGERVLDVATGPGTVAIAAARAVGPAGRVVATDLAPEWGEIVAEEAAAAGIGNVECRTMGAEELALPEASFDVALCQFGPPDESMDTQPGMLAAPVAEDAVRRGNEAWWMVSM
jgi:predicted O-methyltransferase YrrM